VLCRQSRDLVSFADLDAEILEASAIDVKAVEALTMSPPGQ
jgi:hypothetical protein